MFTPNLSIIIYRQGRWRWAVWARMDRPFIFEQYKIGFNQTLIIIKEHLMFAGHLAAGLVLKKVERRLNLGWLFFATLFHDFLLGILVLLGLEQVHIPSNFAQTHYLTFTFPYSHGLAASIFWSLLGFGITYALLPRWSSSERKRAGLAISLVVFSHFILDWMVHIPEIPLLGNN